MGWFNSSNDLMKVFGPCGLVKTMELDSLRSMSRAARLMPVFPGVAVSASAPHATLFFVPVLPRITMGVWEPNRELHVWDSFTKQNDYFPQVWFEGVFHRFICISPPSLTSSWLKELLNGIVQTFLDNLFSYQAWENGLPVLCLCVKFCSWNHNRETSFMLRRLNWVSLMLTWNTLLLIRWVNKLHINHPRTTLL